MKRGSGWGIALPVVTILGVIALGTASAAVVNAKSPHRIQYSPSSRLASHSAQPTTDSAKDEATELRGTVSTEPTETSENSAEPTHTPNVRHTQSPEPSHTPTVTAVSRDQAIAIAKAKYPAGVLQEAHLQRYHKALTWKVVLRGDRGAHAFIWVDATTGSIVHERYVTPPAERATPTPDPQREHLEPTHTPNHP